MFPELDVRIINEDELKSMEAKAIWRPFLMKWEKTIRDFNHGTLLRLDASKDYEQDNTCLG